MRTHAIPVVIFVCCALAIGAPPPARASDARTEDQGPPRRSDASQGAASAPSQALATRPTAALPLRLELAPASAMSLLVSRAAARRAERGVRSSVPPPPAERPLPPQTCALAPLAPLAPWAAMFGAMAAASWAGAKDAGVGQQLGAASTIPPASGASAGPRLFGLVPLP